MTPRLTLNIGVRYDVFTPDAEKDNKLGNFDYSKMAFVFAGVNGVSRTAGIQTRYGNLGSRLGMAFDLAGKGTTVLRAGFGISFLPDPFSASNELGQNSAFTISQTFPSLSRATLSAALANVCTATNTSTCQPLLSNPFPQGAVALSMATLTNTALLDARTQRSWLPAWPTRLPACRRIPWGWKGRPWAGWGN